MCHIRCRTTTARHGDVQPAARTNERSTAIVERQGTRKSHFPGAMLSTTLRFESFAQADSLLDGETKAFVEGDNLGVFAKNLEVDLGAAQKL